MVVRVPREVGDRAISILQDQGEEEVERYVKDHGYLPQGYKVRSLSCEVTRDGRVLGEWSFVVDK